jgi:hypothetical protein
MDTGLFARGLQGMSPTDIRAVAAGLEAWQQTVRDEVAAWRVTMAVDVELRRLRRAREGSAAALRAQRAVLCAASHAAVALPDDEVVRVARAAGDVARGMVVGHALPADVTELLAAWAALFPLREVSAAVA